MVQSVASKVWMAYELESECFGLYAQCDDEDPNQNATLWLRMFLNNQNDKHGGKLYAEVVEPQLKHYDCTPKGSNEWM